MSTTPANDPIVRAGTAVMSGAIDSHCHVWSDDLARYPLAEGRSATDLKPQHYSIDHHLARLAQVGVHRAVVVQHIFNHGFDTRYLTDSARRLAGRVAVIGAAGEGDDEGVGRMLAQKAAGVSGFRLRGRATRDWIGSASMNDMWALAASESLCLCPLVRQAGMDGDALLHLDRMCARHARTVVVIDHMAFVQPGDTMQLERLAALARHAHVHVKIAALDRFGAGPFAQRAPPLVPQVRRLIDAYGASRLMWGSDAPVLDDDGHVTLQACLDFIRHGAGLSATEVSAILETTAARLFFGGA